MVAWRSYSFASHTPNRTVWDQTMRQISGMDERLGYMANFDSYWARRADGREQHAYDYSLSLQAPSEDYRHAVEYLRQAAQREGHPLRPIWTKIETRFAQEANTQPEITCMRRWAERFQAVNDFRPPLAGLIANWYHQGFYPTPVTELFGWLALHQPAGRRRSCSAALARRDYGPGQEESVLAAWRDFSHGHRGISPSTTA